MDASIATSAMPAADQLYARAREALPGGNSRTTVFIAPHPPYAARGEGYRLTDVEGRVVIDLQNNYTSLIHGHAHPRIAAAAQAALANGASFGLPTESKIQLAEELFRRVSAGERWRFANSGTEAVMMAIRVARAATGRTAILRFAGAYHGSADAVVAHEAPGIPPGVAADVIEAPVGDREALDQALERDGARIAAVLFDAMPNRAGLRPASAEFVAHLRQATAAREILLIQDEVLTFRVAYGGLHSRYGITPDLVTLGKVIGGGFPVGAIGGRTDVMACFDPQGSDPVGHGGTFSANPVTMATGLASLELLTEPEIGRINRLGDHLRTALADQGWTVTGLGSLLRIHCDQPEELWWRAYEAGAAIAVNGLACISTPMDDAVIDEVISIFEGLSSVPGLAS